MGMWLTTYLYSLETPVQKCLDYKIDFFSQQRNNLTIWSNLAHFHNRHIGWPSMVLFISIRALPKLLAPCISLLTWIYYKGNNWLAWDECHCHFLLLLHLLQSWLELWQGWGESRLLSKILCTINWKQFARLDGIFPVSLDSILHNTASQSKAGSGTSTCGSKWPKGAPVYNSGFEIKIQIEGLLPLAQSTCLFSPGIAARRNLFNINTHMQYGPGVSLYLLHDYTGHP